MTTHTKITYPRPADTGLVARWINEGDDVFLSADRRYRNYALEAVRETVLRLDLPPVYEKMRLEIVGQGNGNIRGARFGEGPRPELLAEIRRVLRLNGYLYFTWKGWASAVPLTGRQLHVIRLMCQGWTTEDIALEVGINAANIRERMRHVRNQLSCASNVQLISVLYRKQWLPDDRELAELEKARPFSALTDPPGFLRGVQP